MIRTDRAAANELLKPAEIARLCKGKVVRSGATARRISTDTRDIRSGDCFLALRGDRFDGHDYVGEAIAAGATGVIVSTQMPRAAVSSETFVVRVPDTHVALQELAKAHRARRRARVVGITGSCGKTSVKEMLGHVLQAAMPTVRSPKSYNNHIGVPLTLFQIQSKTKAAVVEIGCSEPGEIGQLSRIADPDVAIVTCVAEAHLSGLGTVGGVAKEKGSLVANLRPKGVAILNGDDEACVAMADATDARKVFVRLDREADWFATEPRFCGMGTTFLLQGERPVTMPTLGTHSVYNALFTIAAATELGMDLDAVLAELGSLSPTSRRLEPKVAGDITIFDDTYNMNPASARAGLRALSGLQGDGRKLVVFGGMLELGARSAELHHALGADIAGADIDVLMTVGEDAELIGTGALDAGMPRRAVVAAPDVHAAEDLLADLLRPDDRVLCKASRRFELDRLVDGLVTRLAERGSEPATGAPRRKSRPAVAPAKRAAKRPRKGGG